MSKNLLSGNEWYCQQAFRALNQAAGIACSCSLSLFSLHFLGAYVEWHHANNLVIFCNIFFSVGRCIRHKFDYGAIVLLGNHCFNFTCSIAYLKYKLA